MKFYGNKALTGASGNSGYFIDRSLRFRSSASAYLSRTPASAGNQKTWTWSGWVKRGNLGLQRLFTAGTSGSSYIQIRFDTNDEILCSSENPSLVLYLQTTQKFRDPSAWYHIVVAMDTTQSTAADRTKLYINGSLVTDFSSSTRPAQNTDLLINSTTAHMIGALSYGTTSNPYDGYMADVNFIDGQALDPTYFGEYNDYTGVWQAKKYTGTYGTNGFYLNFSDNSSTTTLGEDGSGNGNDWTLNNISLTSGSTYDSMTDVPTLTSEDAGNYCTWNPLDKGTGATLSEANLKVTTTSGTPNSLVRATIPIKTKAYCEFTIVSQSGAGTAWGVSVVNSDITVPLSNILSGVYQVLYISSGVVYKPASNSGYPTFTTGDVISIAYDPDTKYVWFAKNNTWITGDPSTGTGGFISTDLTNFGTTQSFAWYDGTTNSTQTVAANFGQRPFAYTPPTGFKALNTYNLPDSTIIDGRKHFNTVLWTGTGNVGTRAITGVGFQPDFVWYKGRTYAGSHQLHDVVRGAGKRLLSNTTSGETSTNTYGTLTQFDDDGFTGTQGSTDFQEFNNSGSTWAAWNWKANGSGSSNTDGTITSTVSANTTAGFSIVTYTGNSTSGSTVGHGLGAAPSMVIVKARGTPNGIARSWFVYHSALGGTKFLYLDLTSASVTGSTVWNNTNPSSTVFTLGNENSVNMTSYDYVAYCFAEVEGFSKMGSYTGNGSADGPFVYTGFRPAWVMMKKTSATSNWSVLDASRDSYNVADNPLLPNSSAAESTSTSTSGAFADILSNGFKARGNSGDINDSGATYIFMAFAENPFKNSLAR